MPNISDWPNDAAVCSLSQVLETTSIPQRFFLSSTACAGILRRADKRGKQLPQQLEQALRTVAQGMEPEAETAKTSSSSPLQWPMDKGGAEIGFDRSPTLTCNHEAPIAFHPTQDPISSTDGTTHGLGCGSSGGQASVAVAQPYTLAIRGRGDCHNLEYRQDGTANALLTPNGGRGGIGVGAVAQPIGIFQDSEFGVAKYDSAGTLRAGRIPEHQMAIQPPSMTVRRLTPVECERLQGFPDNYTNIPWRKKQESPDGPRYKALGNSWAVPNVRWIGQRIASALR
jgi:site-specific DNA-cytosine methylase